MFVIFGRNEKVQQALGEIKAFKKKLSLDEDNRKKQLSLEEDNRSIVEQSLHFKDAPNPLYANKLTLTQKFKTNYDIKSFICTDSKVTFKAPKGKCKELMYELGLKIDEVH